MEKEVKFPPIHVTDFSTNNNRDMHITKEDEDSHHITVHVFDSGNMDTLKSKLRHDEAFLLDAMTVTQDICMTHEQYQPVVFEPYKMTFSKRKLKHLVHTGKIELEDLNMGTSKLSDRSGNNEQGQIVLHRGCIDYWEPLMSKQEEYLGHLQTGVGNETSDSSDNEFVESEKATVSHDSKIVSRSAKSETSKDDAGEPDKNQTYVKGNSLEKATQTEAFVNGEMVNEKEMDDVDCRKQQLSEMEALANKPRIKLCNVRQEEIKDIKEAVTAGIVMNTIEGERIWDEVENMIKCSITNGQLRKGKKKSEASEGKSLDNNMKHSVEFRKRFWRTGKERFHFVPKDHMWTVLLEADHSKDMVQLVPLFDTESTFDRVYGKPLEDRKKSVDLMHQFSDRNEELFFSGNNGIFINCPDIQTNGDKGAFLHSWSLVQDQVEKEKYQEILRILNKDHRFAEYDHIDINSVSNFVNHPPASDLTPSGVR